MSFDMGLYLLGILYRIRRKINEYRRYSESSLFPAVTRPQALHKYIFLSRSASDNTRRHHRTHTPNIDPKQPRPIDPNEELYQTLCFGLRHAVPLLFRDIL